MQPQTMNKQSTPSKMDGGIEFDLLVHVIPVICFFFFFERETEVQSCVLHFGFGVVKKEINELNSTVDRFVKATDIRKTFNIIYRKEKL